MDGLGAAHPVEFAFLEHAQELGLQPDVHLGNFVQEDGAAVGHLELAELAGDGPGERAFFVAKQFGFQQMFRQGGAVDGHKGAVGPV